MKGIRVDGWNSKCREPVMGKNPAWSESRKEDRGAAAWWVGCQGGQSENEKGRC